MYKVKIITNNIRWAKKGDILELSNDRAERQSRKGNLKILKYTGGGKTNINSIKKKIRYAKSRIEAWKEEIERLKRLEKIAIKLNAERK